jgi:hypothetical protein
LLLQTFPRPVGDADVRCKQKIAIFLGTEAEVEGDYCEAGLSASGNSYYLKKEREKRVVTKDVMHWISRISTPSQILAMT